MKIWKVEWYIPSNYFTPGLSSSGILNMGKVFSSKEKAEEFSKKIHESAHLLSLSVKCDIKEVEID